MVIAIPTFMREKNQKLYDSLPQDLKDVTFLFTHSGRYELLRAEYPLANIVDLGVTNGIADVRQKIFDYLPYEKVLMLDDNVSFKKKEITGEKITYVNFISDQDWLDWYQKFDTFLDTYAQVSCIDGGIAGHYKHLPYLKNNRVYSVNGFNKELCSKANTSFDYLYRKNPKCYLGEDFYFTLKLLYEGFENLIITDYVFQHPHSKPGGNSVHRTLDMEQLSYELLCEEFPGIISYWKEYDNSWNVGEDETGKCRFKTRISWKKTMTLKNKKQLL